MRFGRVITVGLQERRKAGGDRRESFEVGGVGMGVVEVETIGSDATAGPGVCRSSRAMWKWNWDCKCRRVRIDWLEGSRSGKRGSLR
jgi:hypothetical protein